MCKWNKKTFDCVQTLCFFIVFNLTLHLNRIVMVVHFDKDYVQDLYTLVVSSCQRPL